LGAPRPVGFRAGVKVNITELDIDVLPAATGNQAAGVTPSAAPAAEVNPYVAVLPDSVQQALARRYAELFGVYMKYRDVIERVTFWGVTDAVIRMARPEPPMP
jgi:endo-1,4-beta-xylanase